MIGSIRSSGRGMTNCLRKKCSKLKKQATRGQKERRRSNIFFLLGPLGGKCFISCLFFRKHIHAEGGFFGGDDKR